MASTSRPCCLAEASGLPSSARLLPTANPGSIYQKKHGRKDLVVGRFALALKFYKQSIVVRDSARVRRKIATIREQSPIPELEDHDATKRHAARAYELVPENYEAMIELFDIYMSMEDTDDAERMLKIAIKT